MRIKARSILYENHGAECLKLNFPLVCNYETGKKIRIIA